MFTGNTMHLSRKTIGLVQKALILLVLGFSFLTTAQAKDLRIGMSQEPDTLNPLASNMMASSYMYKAVARTLVIIDKNEKWAPQLATKIPSFENGLAKIVGKGKNKHIVANWEIKPNAVWGDGTPVTGHDVAFSHKIALDPNVPNPQKDDYLMVERVEVDKSNPKKFKLVYREAPWEYNLLGRFYILPKHVEGPVYQKHKSKPGAYSENSEYVKNPTNPALYNGPFVVSEFKLGSHVILKKNPKFYGKTAKINRIIFKLIPNTASLEMNLKSKTIDMIGILGLTFDQAVSLAKKSKNAHFKVNFAPSTTYEHINLNSVKNPILRDINVRRALVHGIDRDEMIKSLFDGKLLKAIQPFSPISPWFVRDPKLVTQYTYSKKKAGQLFDKAGWKMGKDGYRYKNGKKLSLELTTTAGNKMRQTVQAFIQDQLKKVGVEVVIQNHPARVLFGEVLPKLNFKAMSMSAFTFMPEENMRAHLHSTAIPGKSNSYSGHNWSGWKNSKVDRLIEKMEREFNAKRRVKMAHTLAKYYTEEVPVIPLYFRVNISVTPKTLKGYKLMGHRFNDTNHIEDWQLN